MIAISNNSIPQEIMILEWARAETQRLVDNRFIAQLYSLRLRFDRRCNVGSNHTYVYKHKQQPRGHRLHSEISVPLHDHGHKLSEKLWCA